MGSGKFPISIYITILYTRFRSLLVFIDCYCVMFSMGIESVVEKENIKSSSGLRDAGCAPCEMAVMWIQSQLMQNMTQKRIVNNINDVRRTNVYHNLFLKYSNEILLYSGPKIPKTFSDMRTHAES